MRALVVRGGVILRALAENGAFEGCFSAPFPPQSNPTRLAALTLFRPSRQASTLPAGHSSRIHVGLLGLILIQRINVRDIRESQWGQEVNQFAPFFSFFYL
jgi:hypothetical protein